MAFLMVMVCNVHSDKSSEIKTRSKKTLVCINNITLVICALLKRAEQQATIAFTILSSLIKTQIFNLNSVIFLLSTQLPGLYLAQVGSEFEQRTTVCHQCE